MKKLYHYPAMFVLTMLATISLMVFEVSAFFSLIVFKPDIYSEAVTKYKVADAIYEDLDTYFGRLAAPTGIPKEVYMNSIDKESISNSLDDLLKSSFKFVTSEMAAIPEVNYDFTQLEKDITDYIEEYSEENNIEKNDEYYDLIKKTIDKAETQITDRLDVIMLYKLSNSAIARSLHKYPKMINTIKLVSAILMAVFLLAMFFVNRHHLRDMTYWIGSAMFVSAVIFLIPVVYIKKHGFVESFFMKSEHIYRAVTGILNSLLNRIITTQVIMLIIGVLLIVATLVIHMLYKKYLRYKARMANV